MPATHIPEANTWKDLSDTGFGSSAPGQLLDGVPLGLVRVTPGVLEHLCFSLNSLSPH